MVADLLGGDGWIPPEFLFPVSTSNCATGARPVPPIRASWKAGKRHSTSASQGEHVSIYEARVLPICFFRAPAENGALEVNKDPMDIEKTIRALLKKAASTHSREEAETCREIAA